MWITLRHGETDFHVACRYQGGEDISKLTPHGIEQAEELKACLGQLAIDECYCSPMRRTRDTLDLLRTVLKDSFINIVEDLAEIQVKGWEGRLKSDLMREDPNSLMLWRNLPHLFSDGEDSKPLFRLYSRVKSFIGTFHDSVDRKRLIVGHDHVNRAAIASLLDFPMEAHAAIPQATSSISMIGRSTEAHANALYISNLTHAKGRSAAFMPSSRSIILIRHGVTEANERRIYQGTDDISLSETGKLQSELLEEIFNHVEPRLIVSSELCRAKETARLLPFSARIPRRSDARLNEFNYGRWQGLSSSEVEQRYPDDCKAWRQMTSDRPISGGESISNLAGRVLTALTDLVDLSEKKGCIVVVAHDVVIRMMITLSLRLDIRHLWKFPLFNGGVSELTRNSLGSGMLARHNILPGALSEQYGNKYL